MTRKRDGFLVMLAAVLCAAFVAHDARAEVGLVEVCLAGPDHGTTQATLCPPGSRSWERPATGKAVLSCGTLTPGEACIWGNAQMRYRRWQDIGEDELVLTCGSDVPIGPFTTPDPCGSGGHNAGKPNIPKRDVIQSDVVVSGTATLTWTPPSAFVDGSPLLLSQIDKYTIHWGTTSRAYSHSIDVNNGGTQSSVIDLSVTMPTLFYFAVTATVDGVRSAYSNEVSKLIDYVSESQQPGEPTGVTLEFNLTCTDSRPGRTCQLILGESE